jgi:hypothetical protein
MEPVGLQQMDAILHSIGDSLDLHTFDPREVKDLLHDYLEAAQQVGLQEVLIIHGKGRGILRNRVHQILEVHAGVVSFSNAEPGRGGWGATVVRLVPANAGGEEKPEPEEPGPGHAEPGGGTPRDAPPHTLHGLNRPALAAALLLGLGLGALFYQVLLRLGARRVPFFIPLYGVAGFYGLMRRAENLRQVLLRALAAGAVLGAAWLCAAIMLP